METNKIKPGDMVTLGIVNGLGRGTFLVIKLSPRDPIHKLLVRGANGDIWPARIEGAKVAR